jgi:shikimate dehydrogenase
MTNDLYAVIGHPVSHSKSPRIHSLFAEQTGESVEYTAIQAPMEDFEGTVRDFFRTGWQGTQRDRAFQGAGLGPGGQAHGAC